MRRLPQAGSAVIDLEVGDRIWIPFNAPIKDEPIPETSLTPWLGKTGTYLGKTGITHNAIWDDSPPNGASEWSTDSWIGAHLRLYYQHVCGECDSKSLEDRIDYLCENCRKLISSK